MAGNFPLYINQGETFSQPFQWLQSDEEKPVKLGGYTGKCQIRDGAQNQGVIIEIPVTITNADEGRFILSLTAEETKNIPTTGNNYMETEKYEYDVVFTIGNCAYRVINDFVYVSPGVTK